MQDSPPKPVVFLPSDAFGVERIFPIRNVASDGVSSFQNQQVGLGESQNCCDSSAASRSSESTSLLSGQSTSLDDGSSSKQASDALYSIYLPPPYPQIPSEDLIRRSSLSQAAIETPGQDNIENEEPRRISERIQMVPAISGRPGVFPSAFTEDGKPALYRCEDEPIHTPGAIQQYGALVAVRYDQNGNVQVRIASENTIKLLRYGPEQLFALNSFLDLFEEEAREDMVARVNHALSRGHDLSEDTHLDVFTIMIRSPLGAVFPLWCAIHVAQGSKDLVICEFEALSDLFYLDGRRDNRLLPKVPIHMIDNEVEPEERAKSITSGSAPLRVLETARRRKKQGSLSMEIFNAMTQAQQQLAASTSVQGLLDTVVGIISELTGFHRVMFYRFDSEKNGCVDAELIDPDASGDIFRGLHFPASDIPKQARNLYKINRIRILYDRDEETARLVCRDITDVEQKLDLTHSYLRAMSPVHLKYLTNMGVRSSMSVSIVIDSDLWGLIACHSYADIGLRVALPIRELCRNIGECAATNIQRLLLLQRIRSRRPPHVGPPQQTPSGFIAASSTDLLRLLGADFGLLSIQGEARAIGRLDPYREALAILAHLQQRRFTNVLASQNINLDFPDLKYPPGINIIAGLLIIPLSIGATDFLVFFRKGQLNEVRWAGNPYEKVLKNGTSYLEPRSSFKRWTETVVGMSKEWAEDQMDTASVLSLLYGRFIEIWRQKESAGQNNRMTRLLIRNAAHEVRTPLNAIVNYLEIALENKIDDATRDILSNARKASRSLIYVIDDLLNLTKAEDGRVSAPKETFDLGATVSEVITAFRKEAIRKGLDLTVATHPGIPEMVKGDPSRLRQVLSNITSNAFQHSLAGGIKVDIRPIQILEAKSIIGITVQDVGIGMSEAQLDDLFLDFEQIMDEDGSGSSVTPDSSDGNSSLGIGLAVVARYVRNMNGQIRIRSELGKGTIFEIELPFEHAPGTPSATSEVRSSLFPSRPLSASDIRTPRQNSEDNNSETSPPSLPLPDTLSSDELASSLTEVLSPYPPNFNSHGSQGSDNVTSPAEEEDTASNPSSPTFARQSNFPFPSIGGDSIGTHPPQDVLNVLIAEDNPINAKLLSRRLKKLGHQIKVSYNGQECHDYFALRPKGVDVILMDLQMPLVNGDLSTRMIRHYEQKSDELRHVRSRVPIIAVSASLLEENRFSYVQSGFDGWILKPIDFGRLDLLLQGIRRSDLRREAIYTPGFWERGGWFLT